MDLFCFFYVPATMRKTNRHIQQAEEKWLKKLFDYNRDHFKDIGVPSHNHWHHLRVWCFLREILEILEEKGIQYNQDELEGMIIAAFFHDIGMYRTFDEVHGRLGAEKCREYFATGHPHPPHSLPAALEAIEKHDDKRYHNHRQDGEKPGIDVLLAVADDLDAFGATGILRYTEILLLRGFKMEDIPQKVLSNARSRMENFERLFAHNRYLVKKHRQRYEKIRNFFLPLAGGADQQTVNRSILERVQNKLEVSLRAEHLVELIEPADTPAIVAMHDEIREEQKECMEQAPT